MDWSYKMVSHPTNMMWTNLDSDRLFPKTEAAGGRLFISNYHIQITIIKERKEIKEIFYQKDKLKKSIHKKSIGTRLIKPSLSKPRSGRETVDKKE